MSYLGPENHYRTIWISDIHLGTRGCQPSCCLISEYNESESLYLVGGHHRRLAHQAFVVLAAKP